MSETDLAEVWAKSLDELAGMQIEPAHRAWLQLTRPLGLVENTALIATPNEFVKEQLETRLRALITNTLSRELGRTIQLAVTVDPTAVAADGGYRPSGLHAVGDGRDGPADAVADAATGPLPAIVDDGPAEAPAFADEARIGHLGHAHSGDLLGTARSGVLGPIGRLPRPGRTTRTWAPSGRPRRASRPPRRRGPRRPG